MRRVLAGCLLACAVHGAAFADDTGLALIERLEAAAPAEQPAVISAIEAAPAGTPDLDEALFAAARLAEDTLVDPARALALYERLLRDFPHARRAMAAEMRAEALRRQVGTGGAHAREAATLAGLVGEADRLAPDEVVRRATALVNARWPGAPDAALWLAEWYRRIGRVADARALYAQIVERWPGTPQATAALRGGAGSALDAGDWDRAEALAKQMPIVEPVDEVMREELLEAAARGRLRWTWYVRSWFVLVLCGLGLLASLLDAALRGDAPRMPVRRWLEPPVEVLFLAPVSAVLVGVALTGNETIAPAVAILCIAGTALAWLSGAALELARRRARPVRLRAVGHAIACVLTVAALLYILLLRDNLFDMVLETVQFGPEP